jgi:excisionase family DNA binding protein
MKAANTAEVPKREPAASPAIPIEALRLYPVEHVAELACCSVRTILRRIHDGSLPAKKIGRGYGIPHDAAVALLR